MVFLDRNKSALLKKFTFRAAKVPIIYLLISAIFVVISYVDEVIVPVTHWKNFFDVTDKIAMIFLALGIATFIYNYIVLFCRFYERRLRDRHSVICVILSSIRKGLRIIFLLVLLNLIITIIAPTKSYLVIANNIIEIIIICSIGWVAIQILYTMEAFFHHQMTRPSNNEHLRMKVLYTKTHIIRNIATVVIVFITIAIILLSFSSVRNIGISLLASAGFLTAILGLSAQRTLVSLFSGVQIVLSQPIKIGDMVVIDKESGIIEEITFTYVTLKLGDRRRLMVPINYFVEKPFENWSHQEDSMRSSFHFHVDFMMPIEPLREALENILKSSPYWDGEAKKLQVSNLNDRTAEIRVQMSAANADNLSDLRAEVREKLLNFIRENYPDYFPKVRLDGNTEVGE